MPVRYRHRRGISRSRRRNYSCTRTPTSKTRRAKAEAMTMSNSSSITLVECLPHQPKTLPGLEPKWLEPNLLRNSGRLASKTGEHGGSALLGAYPVIWIPEAGNASKIADFWVARSLGAGSAGEIPAPPGNLKIPAPEQILHKDPDLEASIPGSARGQKSWTAKSAGKRANTATSSPVWNQEMLCNM